jgi:hypothetical protein
MHAAREEVDSVGVAVVEVGFQGVFELGMLVRGASE